MNNYAEFNDSLLDEFLVQPDQESFFPGDNTEEWMSHVEKYTDINREIDELMYCDTANDIQLSPLSSDSGNHSPTASSTSGSESQPFFESGWYTSDESLPSQPNQATFNFITPKEPPVSPPNQSPLSVSAQHQIIHSPPQLSQTQSVQDVQVLYLVPVDSPPANVVQPSPLKPLPVIRPKTEIDIVTQCPPAPTPAPFVFTTPITFAALPTPAPAALPKIEIPVQRRDTVDSGYEDFAKKKEDRKLRNRAAAQLSRQRKREEVEGMQKRLRIVEEENKQLLDSNDKLKKRIEVLQSENEVLKTTLQARGFIRPSPYVSKQKAGAVLFVFALIITFHGAPFLRQIELDNETDFANQEKLDYAAGRSLPLLSAASEDLNGESYRNSSIPYLDECRNGTKAMNLTETIRLNDDLSQWVSRHELLDDYKIHHGKNPLKKIFKKEQKKSSLATVVNDTAKERESLKDARHHARAWKHLNLLSSYEKPIKNYTVKNNIKTKNLTVENSTQTNSTESKNYELQLPSDTERQYRQLVAALKQRSDTLYLVAMKDYFLLPPTNTNSTSRPRMSLVLPALSMNNEAHPNQVTMMRIECEVVGTGLFNIPRSLLPLFFNQTTYP
ncbi:hypothetical protein L596_019705 [Steinernema carpocapsae]|uniref:BZIP domain-containing protein n=1 Tax=Steinernema carpocapsae TaxID=34508 RepID=A0A4U5MRE7_STECR|nr:hypothetical protein L596_019705 [Steinernema carpocapsae]